MVKIKTFNAFINETKKVEDDSIDKILNFKYEKMKHIYNNKSESDNYTMEVTNWDNSYYNEIGGEISSIFLTSNNDIKDELEWYEENSKLEFLNGYDYSKINDLGKSVELVTFIGDDNINEYFNFYKNDYDYIWAQYFTDSEKIDMDKALAITEYNNREIIIVIKHKF